MSQTTYRVLMTLLFMLGMGGTVWSQSVYPTATVIISGAQSASPASGTMTIAFSRYSETVPYGPFSTASTIAADFAAIFSVSQSGVHPCMQGVCAKATGATIVFQLTTGSFGPITITSTSTTGTNPFGGSVPTSSNISLISSANPSTFGAPVTFTANVPNGATGNVNFYYGTTSHGSATISGTTASYTNSSLAVGTHSVIAIYIGDGTYSGSTSGAVAQVVNQAIPTVTLATSGTPSTQGVAVTFTATVSGLLTTGPTGLVTFYDGSTSIGSGTVSGTMATITTNTLTVGTHSITATYGGDANFAAATSGAINQVVQNTASPIGGIITTVAGNGIAGYSGNGGAAAIAELDSPSGVSVDTNGDIYIADAAKGYIREVNGTIITTVAGDGGSYTGNGPATSTGVSAPFGITIDANSNIYIADTYDSRVLEVHAATGILTSVAGGGYGGDNGAATSAYLGAPMGVSVDASENIYIADVYTSSVRKVSPAGTITTVAGDETYGYGGDGGAAVGAELASPQSVSADASGNIYIADTDNNRIRKVDAAGTITTVAGNGIAGYSGDGNAATSAELNAPEGVYVDVRGNIYIADGGNNRIRKVNPAGIITTIAGNGTAGYSGDGGIATNAELNFTGWGTAGVYVGADGTIYIADYGNNRIRAVSPISNPLGITVATSGSPSVYGSPVTFIATVPSGDTNAVTFYNGSNPLGTAAPSNGTASLTVSNLPAGVNPINATIAAGGSYPVATSEIIDQTVNPLTSTIGISNIPTNAGYGGSFTATYNYSGNGSPSVSSSTPSVCVTSDSTVSYLGVGTCMLQASVAATADYAAVTGDTQSFIVSPPTIEGLSPTSGPESTSVTISGIGFGFSPATTTVSFNGTAANLLSWSNTSIVTAVPLGATTGNVVVTANGNVSNGVLFTVQATSPTIVTLSPTSGNAGLAVIISGSGFGTTEGQSTVKFNNITAGVLNWSDSSITAIVPSNATTGPVVVYLSNGQTSNTNVVFTDTGAMSCSP